MQVPVDFSDRSVCDLPHPYRLQRSVGAALIRDEDFLGVVQGRVANQVLMLAQQEVAELVRGLLRRAPPACQLSRVRRHPPFRRLLRSLQRTKLLLSSTIVRLLLVQESPELLPHHLLPSFPLQSCSLRRQRVLQRLYLHVPLLEVASKLV